MKRSIATTLLEQRASRMLADIGGQPLEGSGFEAETPEDGFSGPAVPVGPVARLSPDAPYICDLSRAPRKTGQ
jgi:hypothetical protein